MLKTLLHTTMGLAFCLTLHFPSLAQNPCDCVNAGNCPTQAIDNAQVIIELPVNMPGNHELGSCPLESVCITLSHTWIGDFSISLESPNGEHYLIMADMGNNFGECGTQQDNAEFCIVPGTNHPLSNNTEYVCNSAPCSLGTCCLNGDWTVPCGGVISPLTDAVQAPHCDLNDFNVPGAPVNGVWKLLVLDVCNMDVGIVHNASLSFGCSGNPSGSGCEASGGLLGMDDMVICNGTQLDVSPHFCGGEPSAAAYSYKYVVAQNDAILAFLPQVDLSSFPFGQYEIWGFSHSTLAESQLSSLIGGSLQSTITLFDSSSEPFCGDFSADGFLLTNFGAPSVNIGPDLVLNCWETSQQLSATDFPNGSNFSYEWALPTGQTIANQTSIQASISGEYIFTVSEASSGCVISDTMQLAIPPPLIADIATQTATCNQADGTASVSLQPGITNAEFVWSNGVTTQTNTGLAQGWYSVTVSDQYCTYHQNVYVDEDRSCKVTIRGRIVNDSENEDCMPDLSPIGVECIMLHLMPADIYTYSLSDGSFEFVVDAGNYTIEYVDEDLYEVLCPPIGIVSVSLPNDGVISEGNNFYVKKTLQSNLCINMNVSPARPGFTQNSYFSYCNFGTAPMNAVITFVHDPLLESVNLASIADTYDPATHTATWTVENIQPGACKYIYYSTRLPATVPLGTPLSGSIRIDPVVNDFFPQNNSRQWTQYVVGSFDPNEKSTQTGENQWGGLIHENDSILHYQIQFQNTGTDTAFTVVVRDTVDADLDVETIRPGLASHRYQLEFEGNNVLVFNFRDIMLPDSNRNEPASHGAVTFSIKRKPGLALGTEIHNSAAIFFDYNAPIITNTVTHTLDKYQLHTQQQATVCEGDVLNGTLFEADTTLVETYSYATYDSIVTTQVDVLPTSEYAYTAPICEGSSYLFNGQNLSVTGEYQAVLTAANGCDSTVTLNLQVLPAITTSFQAVICEGDSYSFAGQNLTTAGIYQSTYTAVGGCDSTSVLTLVVLQNAVAQVSAAICEGESYLFNGQTLTNAGTYQATMTAANGCDSTVTLILNINEPIETQFSASICASDSYYFNGQELTSPGIYQAVLSAVNGCDSTVTLMLAVLPVSIGSEEVTICEGEIIEFGGQTIHLAGVYQAVYQSENGCDSLVTLTVNVAPNEVQYISEEICQGETYVFGGQVLAQTGDYTATATTSLGCTSTSFLHLDVLPNSISYQPIELVVGSLWNGVPIYEDTTIEEHYTATNGCDSTLFVQITVITGTRDAFGASYDLLVFPNPFDASTTIELKGIESNKALIFKLLDVTGRTVQQQAFLSPKLSFQRENLPSGLYFIKIESEDGQPVAVGRVVAKRGLEGLGGLAGLN